MHSAYPVIVLYYAAEGPFGLVYPLFFLTVMLGIWFAAVYNQPPLRAGCAGRHHYGA